MSTLHIYLDEAGDWEFSAKGSKYFAMSALWTFEPDRLAIALTRERFKLLGQGVDVDSFHASPDKQSTRNLVVDTMLATKEWHFAAVLMEKRRVNPTIRDPQHIYPRVAIPLLRFVLRSIPSSAVSKLLVFADTINVSTKAKREGILKAIKRACAAELKAGQPHHAFSHRRESNALLQAADYALWSVFTKWERGETRTYDRLRTRMLRPEICITDRGDGTSYY